MQGVGGTSDRNVGLEIILQRNYSLRILGA